MATDWREVPHVPDQSGATVSESPSHRSSLSRSTASKRSLACERCFKRKQKCDRLQPTCTPCADFGVECVARSQQFDFTEDVGLTPARVNGYVDSLKRRIADLEHKLLTAAQEHDGTSNDSPNAVNAILASGNSRRQHLVDSHYIRDNESDVGNEEQQSSVQDTMSAIGLLSNKAMAEHQANVVDTPHKLALSECISAALDVDGHDPSAASSSQQVFVVEDQAIPLTRDLTISHLERFLDWSVLLPYIDESRLMEQYETVLNSQGQEEVGRGLGLPHFNVYMAIAIGISMSAEAGRLSYLIASLHRATVKLLPRILDSREPLDTLHCMLLLVVFSMFNPAGGSTWHLMGFILTNCIATGLHKEAIPKARLGSQSIYRTEWLFWSIYLLDRSLAVAMGRPFGIHDGDISVSVPTNTEDHGESSLSESTTAKLAMSRHLVAHAQLISDIRCNNRGNALFSYSNICFWRESAPSQEASSSDATQLDFLEQLACRALMLTITLSYQPLTNPEFDKEDLADVQNDTIYCCKKFIEKSYSRSGSAMVEMSFVDAYDVLSAAIVYVCLLQRPSHWNQQGLTQIFEIITKASILLTRCSSRFSALSTFQQFLLTLSSNIMDGQISLQEYHESIPSAIPGHLRRFIQYCCSPGTLAG